MYKHTHMYDFGSRSQDFDVVVSKQFKIQSYFKVLITTSKT